MLPVMKPRTTNSTGKTASRQMSQETASLRAVAVRARQAAAKVDTQGSLVPNWFGRLHSVKM